MRRSGPLRRRTQMARVPAQRRIPVYADNLPKADSPGRRRARTGGQKPFPPVVAALLDERDPWCQRCGSPRDLERHHRRAKHAGGSRQGHTQCACNGIRLCREHHAWVHAHPGQARDEGYIVSQSAAEPRTVAVMRFGQDGGASMYPTCDGQWTSDPPEVCS